MIRHISQYRNAPYSPVKRTGVGKLNLKNVVKILAAPFVWIVRKIRAIWKKIFGPKSHDHDKRRVDRKPLPSKTDSSDTSAKKAGDPGNKPSTDRFSKVEDPELAKKALEFERYCHSKKEEIIAFFNIPNGPKVEMEDIKIRLVPTSRIHQTYPVDIGADIVPYREVFSSQPSKPRLPRMRQYGEEIKYKQVEMYITLSMKRQKFNFLLNNGGIPRTRREVKVINGYTRTNFVKIPKEEIKNQFSSKKNNLDKTKSNEEQLNELKQNIQATFPVWCQIYSYLEENSAKFKEAYDCSNMRRDLHVMHYEVEFPEVRTGRVKVGVRIDYVYKPHGWESNPSYDAVWDSHLEFYREFIVDQENQDSFCNDFKRLIDHRFDRFVRKNNKRMKKEFVGDTDTAFTFKFEESSDEDEKGLGGSYGQVKKSIESLVGMMGYEEKVKEKLINLFDNGKFDELDRELKGIKKKGWLRFHPDKSADGEANENFQKFNSIFKNIEKPLGSFKKMCG